MIAKVWNILDSTTHRFGCFKRVLSKSGKFFGVKKIRVKKFILAELRFKTVTFVTAVYQ